MAYEPSKTAQGVALLRAVHQMIDAFPKILDDPIAARLFPPATIADIADHPERFQSPLGLGLRAHVVVRSRYAEDQLALAVARGVRQYLILGAGWDTFAYRQPAWAQDIRIFEVDQPASQREKAQRLHDAGIAVPPNTTLVPVDFETTSLSTGLQASQFDFTAPTFIAWLGVMVYLTPDAIDAVLRFAADRPKGSEIVLTFSTPPSDPQNPGLLITLVAKGGEPWQTYFTEDELMRYLTSLGFATVTIPTPDEIATWYIGERHDGLATSQRANIARASV